MWLGIVNCLVCSTLGATARKSPSPRIKLNLRRVRFRFGINFEVVANKIDATVEVSVYRPVPALPSIRRYIGI